jgi:phosphatidylglycerophosphatase A
VSKAMSNPLAPPKWMYWLATWFGCGYAKRAPGTAGSLGALPLFLLLSCYDPLVSCRLGSVLPCGTIYGGVTILLGGLGILSAGRIAAHAASEDPQMIVIDEVVGSLIALGIAQHSGLWAVLTAWVLFRLLDIWKPWPISAAEHAKPVGLGIMLDDILAGAVAGLIAWAIFPYR